MIFPFNSHKIHICWCLNLHFPSPFVDFPETGLAQMLLFEFLNGAFLYDDQLSILHLELR